MEGLRMPWCPNCKSEYQDGYETCSDCNVSLVDELESELEGQDTTCELIDMNSLESTEKLIDFLNYSKIRKVSCEFFEETNSWKVSVLEEDVKEAIKLLKAFLLTEMEEKEKDEPIVEDDTPKIAAAYVKKEDKYNDFKSSVAIFIPFGIIGLVVILLNLMGVFHFLTSTFQMIILSACFIAFIYVGLHSLFQLKKIREEIEEENKETSIIIDWLKENVTLDHLSHNIKEDDSDEIRYIKQTTLMKNMVLDEFHDMDEGFVDQLIEDYYNDYIDSDE